MAAGLDLREVLRGLRLHHGPPPTPPTRDPFEIVLYENVVYLADDEKRRTAFEALRAATNCEPSRILTLGPARLRRAFSAGIVRDLQVVKLQACARIVLDDLGGDLAPWVAKPLPEARKALMRFPSIGAPGADKILLLSGAHRVFAVDSNGLRVLNRLGFGRERRDYAATYRETMAAVEPLLSRSAKVRAEAHSLLRAHGQRLCRRSRPLCAGCPVRSLCAHGRTRG